MLNILVMNRNIAIFQSIFSEFKMRASITLRIALRSNHMTLGSTAPCKCGKVKAKYQ